MPEFPLTSVTNISSKDTYSQLIKDKDSYLIDVRSKLEWANDGVPDLSKCHNKLILIEWVLLPYMKKNENFLNQFDEKIKIKIENNNIFFFICRSGIRSNEAAEAVNFFLNDTDYNFHCLNVVDGFNNDNGSMPSEYLKGWKNEGLPWNYY